MVFSSLVFLYAFLPAVLFLYFIFKNYKVKNYVLLFFSILFYSWGEPRVVFLLLLTCLINYSMAIWIHNSRNKFDKIALLIAIIFDIGALFIFKYLVFITTSLNSFFSLNINVPQIILPIGISFYTFQILTYVIDVYWNKAKVQYSFANFLLYVSMFPQLVAGPIVRYTDIQNQIDKRIITFDSFSGGVTRFMTGLAKKIIIANHAGEIATYILDFKVMPAGTLFIWYGIIMYTIQIYFDFSAYSDMAIGLGKMFGFDFMENFNYPYSAKTVTEFWRKWHISLSTFFRDYVYIPLGGNRKHQTRNIFIVWSLTGIWHGASWNFMMWGIFYGIILILEKKFFISVLNKIPSIFGHIYTMLIVIIGWVLFYFTDISELTLVLKNMFVPLFTVEDFYVYQSLNKNLFFIIIAFFISTGAPIKILNYLKNKINYRFVGTSTIIYNTIIFFTCTALLTGQTHNPFLYFRF